jgi:ribosomal protein S12 methylthiotransferase
MDTRYAVSDWNGQSIAAQFYDLCGALGTLGVWVRLHYVYPYPHVDRVLPLMAEGKILPYLDIPFQHASPTLLKAMRRPANQEKTLERIAGWRNICPDLVIRSSFIVGFPGETEEDFILLLDWLKEARLARVGCFKYENVHSAGSHDFVPQVPEDVKDERYARFMEAQQSISEEVMQERIGTAGEGIIDEGDEEGAIGRSAWDAPDIDGMVFLNGETELVPGDIVRVTIKHTEEYDVWAELAQS